LNGLAHLHGLVIIHRDLKPAMYGPLETWSNRTIQSQNCRLLFSQRGLWNGRHPLGGPEILSNLGHLSDHFRKSDIWAYGCIVYEMEICSLERRKAFYDWENIKSFAFGAQAIVQINWKTWRVIPRATLMALRGPVG